MPQPQRPSRNKKFVLSTAWSCGSRTSHWDILWTRLLCCALPPRNLSPDVNKNTSAQERPLGEVADGE